MIRAGLRNVVTSLMSKTKPSKPQRKEIASGNCYTTWLFVLSTTSSVVHYISCRTRIVLHIWIIGAVRPDYRTPLAERDSYSLSASPASGYPRRWAVRAARLSDYCHAIPRVVRASAHDDFCVGPRRFPRRVVLGTLGSASAAG